MFKLGPSIPSGYSLPPGSAGGAGSWQLPVLTYSQAIMALGWAQQCLPGQGSPYTLARHAPAGQNNLL